MGGTLNRVGEKKRYGSQKGVECQKEGRGQKGVAISEQMRDKRVTGGKRVQGHKEE